MTELIETGIEVLSDALTGVPAPVKLPFFKAIGQLLGNLTQIPAAMARRPAQALEDTTIARSAVAAALAAGVAQRALENADVMRAAEEIYLPTNVRKATNRIRVAQAAAEHIAESDADSSNAAEPDEDWLNLFARFAEDASSERLQDMFGRILAGEVVHPGSFSLPTLRVVSELDQSVARDFARAWDKSVGDAVDYSAEWQRGEMYSLWKRLADAGLMAHDVTSQYLPAYSHITPSNSWVPMAIGPVFLSVYFREDCKSSWRHIPFTRTGREIGSIIPKPDHATNMRNAASSIPKPGISLINLNTAVGPTETVYRETN